jgi:F-type H+-transporting ATPase subunit epsilon
VSETFLLEVATPERLVIREHVAEAQIPAAEGFLGILPEHSALLSEMGAGDLTYTVGGEKHTVAVAGGWVEVGPEQTRVLANVAEKANEIDVKRAEAALKRAEERLYNPPADLDVARAINAMKRAQARLAAAGKPALGR